MLTYAEQKQVIFLIIQLSVYVIDLGISMRNPRKWRDDKMFLSAFQCEVNSEGRLQIAFNHPSKKSKAVAKLQKAVKKLLLTRKLAKKDSPQLMGNIINQETLIKRNVFMDYKDNPLILKYYVSILLLACVIFFVFVYLPVQGNINKSYSPFCNSYFKLDPEESFVRKDCNNWKDNSYIVLFYIIYMSYFACSFIQVKYGVSRLRYANILRFDYMNYAGTLLIKFTPFMLELRTIIAWIVTNTSLTLTDWFKLEDIFIEIFLVQFANMRRSLYQRQGFLKKILIGCGSFYGISLILIFPMILFSGLNPIANPNLVREIDFELGMSFNDSFYFTISQMNHNQKIAGISKPSTLICSSYLEFIA